MDISASIRRVTQLFIILFVALSAGLVYWQVVVAQQVTANIHNGRHCLSDAAPVRRRIFDRNGVLLAESVPSKTAICGYVRHYTEPSLVGLIGYYISPLFPSTGLEHKYDDFLGGRLGSTALDNTLNEALHRPPVGDDIYLTIDVRIQRIVNHYFDEPIGIDNVQTFKTDRGSVIVTDPHTGEILAMLSRPGFDPNRVAAGDLTYFHQLETDPKQPLLERPLLSRYVPGSTYKTVTLLAGLDSGQAHLSDTFDEQHALGPVVIGPPQQGSSSLACIVIPPQSCGDGSEEFGPVGNNIVGYTHHFPVDVRYGFAHSDNIIFAQVGANTGVNTWLDYNSRFYVGKQISFDLPVAVSTVMRSDGKPLGVNGLAENAFGQGVDFMTPFQMSLFDDAIANNGQLMQPMLVSKIVDPNGALVQSFSSQPLGNQQISDTTASQMRDAMYGVVRCGSGSIVPKLYGSPWAIIAKTGTGEVGGGNPAEAWLLTQAPYLNPRLTILAMKENGGEGGYINGPMVADMYNDIFTNVLKMSLPPTPDPQNPYCFNNGLLQ